MFEICGKLVSATGESNVLHQRGVHVRSMLACDHSPSGNATHALEILTKSQVAGLEGMLKDSQEDAEMRQMADVERQDLLQQVWL